MRVICLNGRVLVFHMCRELTQNLRCQSMRLTMVSASCITASEANLLFDPKVKRIQFSSHYVTNDNFIGSTHRQNTHAKTTRNNFRFWKFNMLFVSINNLINEWSSFIRALYTSLSGIIHSINNSNFGVCA